MKTLKIQFLIAIMLIATGWLQAQNTVGPFTYYPTNVGGTMQGQAQINGLVAAENDVVAAFSPNPVECVGAAKITWWEGVAYINFVIYGDDGDGHGMSPGENFTLKLRDSSEHVTLTYSTTLAGWQNTNFAPMPGYDNPNTVYNFISQMGTVTPANRAVTCSSGSTTFAVASNTTWTVTDNASWLSASPSSGSNNGTITANYSANNTGVARTATISVTFAGIASPVAVTVTQATSVTPTLTTTAVSNIAQTTATSGGNITSDGGATVTARGVCWNTTGNPTTNNPKTSNGTGTGSFTSSITGLSPSTSYYVRAYATNGRGTAYGSQILFTTSNPDPVVPTLTTTAASNITQTTAASGGNITSDGGAIVTTRGVCWNTTGNPTIANSKTSDGSGTGIFTSSITGLVCATNYYVRAYAINSVGTAYGTQQTFATLACPCALPTVSSSPATNITFNAATYTGNVTNDGGCVVTSRGFCRSSTGIPTIANNPIVCGSGTGTFSCDDSGLEPEKTYFIRAWAINSTGTAYSTARVFNTPAGPDTPWEVVWTMPFSPMNFFVYKATIDEIDMVAGDWIGLFDIDPNTGLEICVGMGELTAPLVGGEFFEILVSMNDGTVPGQANGFTPGHEIIYKLWNPAKGEVDHVDANYPYPGFDETYAALGTTLVELDGLTVILQTFNLTQNWNLISFRCAPLDPNMLDIFDPLIVNQSLFKVLDQDGGLMIHLPAPPPNGMWYNSIGDLSITEGYYVKVLQATSFTVEGFPLDFPFVIPLHASWNMAGFPSEIPQDAMSLVQPLINAGKLVKVIDEQGHTIVFTPFPEPNGQWVNTIGNFTPNKGYYINVNAAGSLTINTGRDNSTPSKTLVFNKGDFFNTSWTGNPYMPMHLIFDRDERLEDGDELAVFDGDICVGSVEIIAGEPVIVTAASDDPDTEIREGFIAGNPVLVKVWKQTSGEILNDVHFTVVGGYDTFAPLETMYASLDFLPTIVAEMNNETLCTIQPNPFNSSTIINLTIAQEGMVNIQLFDITGNNIKTIANSTYPKGKHQIVLRRDELTSGYYILQTTISSHDNFYQLNDKLIVH